MTATAQDTITVAALTRDDAPDIATRQWEAFGFRVLRVVDVVAVEATSFRAGDLTVTPAPYQWRVTADVEVRR